MPWDAVAKAIAALIFVLGLFGAAVLVMRRLRLGGGAAGFGRKRRLALVETLALDNRRRLVLVRRDGREHLLLVGGGADLVVEGRIADFSQQLKDVEETAP
jgi:flagellar protein FliO/FliZ